MNIYLKKKKEKNEGPDFYGKLRESGFLLYLKLCCCQSRICQGECAGFAACFHLLLFEERRALILKTKNLLLLNSDSI